MKTKDNRNIARATLLALVICVMTAGHALAQKMQISATARGTVHAVRRGVATTMTAACSADAEPHLTLSARCRIGYPPRPTLGE